MRFPRGFLQGNTLDMGNYHQCLGINEEIENSVIEGKYCIIRGPLDQNFVNLAENLGWDDFDKNTHFNEDVLSRFEQYEAAKSKSLAGMQLDQFSSLPDNPLTSAVFRLALCIPKTCTTAEGMRGLLFNLTAVGIHFEEEFCRFTNDKPWVPVDYIAIAIFSLIGLLTILSTGYDLWHTFYLKKDPKTASTLCRSFSVYTNGRRLTTFSSNPGMLHCVDGVRMLSMLWIIVGHTYTNLPPRINNLDVLVWLMAFRSLWITAAPYAVDTFLFLGGLLIIYTTAGKLSGMKLLKNLHLFYLNRLLRLFPLLATAVLLQASVLHRVADGPLWNTVATNTNRCRTYWWATLLYIQNYLVPGNDCINHAWYLAIDMQLHIISPIILFWVLSGKRNLAWIALTAGLMVSLAINTTYSFIMQFPGWSIGVSRPGGATAAEYMPLYYFNTWTRAPPFFVGMVFGYLLHVYKERKVKIPNWLAWLLWILTVASTAAGLYSTYLMKDFGNYDLWLLDDMMNSFGRSIWVMAVGWVIFACHYGYGGPINWFLCLNIWKLPSRISLGLYLFHYPIQFVVSGTAVAPIHFTDAVALYEFTRQLVLSYGVAFLLTLVIDSPCSILVKLVLGDGPKKPKKEIEDKE